ncbi:VOC family protein [Nocardiopsis sp. NPDC058789]|uniref:VOC family protein n=1 Tax=Nocardiopsis eucommiae TaxID=2831970 RepID=A0A975LA49_9ACTN|nr:VOC family protein [Nocardiopsis eucommiae]
MTVGSVAQWVVNAVDPPALARFWAFVIGGEVELQADGWAVLHGAAGQPRLSFQPTPELKARPNRVHADVIVEDLSASVRSVVDHGATTVGEVVTEEEGSFQVLRDPEGNEFCLVEPDPQGS